MFGHNAVPLHQLVAGRGQRSKRDIQRQRAYQQAVGRRHRPDGVGDVEVFVVINPEEPIAAQVGKVKTSTHDNLFWIDPGSEAAVEVRGDTRRYVFLQDQVGIPSQVV